MGSCYNQFVNTDSGGNLLSRHRHGSHEEEFAYDELDRLSYVTVNKLLDMKITYLPNGNINGMTDVGMYTYDDTDRPHAVRSVENFLNEISHADVTTTFNDINKVSAINKSGGDDDYTMTLSYGPDCQRWRSVLEVDGRAEYGATAGAYAGAHFGGVGALPGALIGGAAGAFLGDSLGDFSTEYLFNTFGLY